MKPQTVPAAVPTIEDEPFESAVFDNGRRGEPLPGCDCIRCFGYCMIDAEERQRQLSENERNAREDEVAP